MFTYSEPLSKSLSEGGFTRSKVSDSAITMPAGKEFARSAAKDGVSVTEVNRYSRGDINSLSWSQLEP